MSRYRVILGWDVEMMKYLYDRTGMDLRGQNLNDGRWFCVSARHAITGRIGAALASELSSPFEAHFTAAVDDPAAISRRALTGVFQALFTKVARITARVEATDNVVEDIVQRMGFVYEGFLRRGYDGIRDALIYGMLREDCKYLPDVARPMNGEDHDETANPTRSIRDSLGATERQRRERGGISYN